MALNGLKKPCRRLTRIHWSSSVQRLEAGRDTLYTWTLCLLVSRFVHGSSAGVTGSCGLVQLVLASCLRAAIQHPGISHPVSLLMHSSAEAMWMLMASLSGSGTWSVNYCLLLPSDGVVVLPNMLCCCWLLQSPSLADISMLPQLHSGALCRRQLKAAVMSELRVPLASENYE